MYVIDWLRYIAGHLNSSCAERINMENAEIIVVDYIFNHFA